MLGYLLGYLLTDMLLPAFHEDWLQQRYNKPHPHTDLHDLRFRQSQFLGLGEDAADAASPLLDQFQFTKYASNDRITNP